MKTWVLYASEKKAKFPGTVASLMPVLLPIRYAYETKDATSSNLKSQQIKDFSKNRCNFC